MIRICIYFPLFSLFYDLGFLLFGVDRYDYAVFLFLGFSLRMEIRTMQIRFCFAFIVLGRWILVCSGRFDF